MILIFFRRFDGKKNKIPNYIMLLFGLATKQIVCFVEHPRIWKIVVSNSYQTNIYTHLRFAPVDSDFQVLCERTSYKLLSFDIVIIIHLCKNIQVHVGSVCKIQ